MRYAAIAIGSLLLIPLCVSPAIAQNGPDLSTLRVTVAVSGGDIQSRVKSCLSREVRSLGDVAEVYNRRDADVIVETVAQPLRNQGGQDFEYALSTLFLDPPTMVLVGARASAYGLSDGRAAALVQLAEKEARGAYEIKGHQLITAGRDNLDSACANIIADLDTQVLDALRKVNREAQKMLNQDNQ